MTSVLQPAVTRLAVEFYGENLVIVHDPKTGLRVAGRDFEAAKTIMLDGVALLEAKAFTVDPKPENGRSGLLWVLPSVIRYVAILVPIVLVVMLLAASIRQTFNMSLSSAGVFRSLRLGTFKLDAALKDIEPKNREEIILALRSIAVSLKPYADELRPLLYDKTQERLPLSNKPPEIEKEKR